MFLKHFPTWVLQCWKLNHTRIILSSSFLWSLSLPCKISQKTTPETHLKEDERNQLVKTLSSGTKNKQNSRYEGNESSTDGARVAGTSYAFFMLVMQEKTWHCRDSQVCVHWTNLAGSTALKVLYLWGPGSVCLHMWIPEGIGGFY